MPFECGHPSITEEAMRQGIADMYRLWDSDRASFLCGDCGEWLYPELDGDDEIVVYVGEPKGAGDDPWGRPNPSTHPEYWME